MKPLFRPEAVEHHRASAMGVVVTRQHRAMRWAIAALCLGLLGLGWWLVYWEVDPGHSLLEWITARGLPGSESAR